MEYLDNYRPGHLESAVVDFYRRHHIRSPQDIHLEMFAEDAGIHVHYVPFPSTSYELKSGPLIAVDNRLPWVQQRVEFAHELGHILLHCGRQHFMTDDFRALQEFQADRFAMYALAPTYMITNCIVQAHSRQQLVSQLAYTFDVTEPFMDARLQLLEQRMQGLVAQQQMATAIAEASVGYDYSYRHPTNHNVELLVRDGNIVGHRRRAAL